MAIIYSHFLNTLLKVHKNIKNEVEYPAFDPACIRYEALRSVMIDKQPISKALKQYEISEYEYKKSEIAFKKFGTYGLIALESKKLIEELPIEIERMVYVLKATRPWIPATKMVMILEGFDKIVSLRTMRHLYASYGWAQGTKEYKELDFMTLNLKIMKLDKHIKEEIGGESFFKEKDRLQKLLEVFRTFGKRGITKRYPTSRVTYEEHKKWFKMLGLIGLVEKERRKFRNSKLGFKEEGSIVLSKIQKIDNTEEYYQKVLETKGIKVDKICIVKVFMKWNVQEFQSKYKGEIERLLLDNNDVKGIQEIKIASLTQKNISISKLDISYISFIEKLGSEPIPISRPGIFLFLPYLNTLKVYEKTCMIMDIEQSKGYSWFTMLLLNIGRILGGVSSISKTCKTKELSIPLMSGLIEMPCKDSMLNVLGGIGETELLELRQYLTYRALEERLIEGKRIGFDFHMREFTGDDVELKRIGKGPTPKRQICFPGFRPHVAWDISTGVPISLEFRNGKSRGTTTIKRFIDDLINKSIGKAGIDRVYVDSEYTGESTWKFFVDKKEGGLGADLTMCIKQNKKVKKYIETFLESNPNWKYYDEEHTYTEETFEIPIKDTSRSFKCMLKRQEKTGKLRCFGSTIEGLNGMDILNEYRHRWTIENGIKDLTENYFFDDIPGINPHRINVHYFIVTLVKLLFEMLSRDFEGSKNVDGTKKGIGTLREEFIVGTNAILYREKDVLILKWIDLYPEKQHKLLEDLFIRLSEEGKKGMPFLGDLKIRYEIVPKRDKNFRNQFEKAHVTF